MIFFDKNIRLHKEHEYEKFFNLKNENVLIYWPHGLGDWVYLGYILNYADESNNYYVTRYGDDYVSVFDACDKKNVKPLYFLNGFDPNNGRSISNENFQKDRNDNSDFQNLTFPSSIYHLLEEKNIINACFHALPERHGDWAFPFHTKARQQFKCFMDPSNPILHKPLLNIINFEIPNFFKEIISANLLNNSTISRSSKLCLINHIGASDGQKNWPATEALKFINSLKEIDGSWKFISFLKSKHKESLHFPDLGCFDFYKIFDNLNVPFSFVLKYLLIQCSLFVGIHSGPYALSVLCENHPTILICKNSLPSWYDEPKKNSVSVISRSMQKINTPGSFFNQSGLNFPHVNAGDDIISGDLIAKTYLKYFHDVS